jgi:hypothetical protein
VTRTDPYDGLILGGALHRVSYSFLNSGDREAGSLEAAHIPGHCQSWR